MRSLVLCLIISFVLLFLADAVAILHKRVSPNMEVCVQDINAIIPELDSQQPFIRTSQVLETRQTYEKLRDSILKAQSSCCDIISLVSEEDALYYLDSVETMDVSALSLLSLLRDKVDDFNFLVKIVVNTQIRELDRLTIDLYTCFVVFTPREQIDTLYYSMDNLQTSFNLTMATYNTLF